MNDRWRFLLNRLFERLWVKPLLMCIASMGLAFVAHVADGMVSPGWVPEASSGSLETLLKIMSSSMLVIATFAVSSMVAAYSSASSTATPRSFPLIIADDGSQNALSAFVGSFIFSIVALVALQNGYYDQAGRFVLFSFTIGVFTIVIITFVKWVDSIARLGRLGSTIRRVEDAAAQTFRRRKAEPLFGGAPLPRGSTAGRPIYADSVGYVQRIDVAQLQAIAEAGKLRICVALLPGSFAAPGEALVYVKEDDDGQTLDEAAIREAFVIGAQRTFDEDPRFGLIVLSEIASRALSPAVNDPGTAIDIIGSFVRLFAIWNDPVPASATPAAEVTCPLVQVPELCLDDMLEDALRSPARDGAGTVEVMIRLLKALQSMATCGDDAVRESVTRFARDVEARALDKLSAKTDRLQLQAAASFCRASPLP